jgi:hypothetical protein
MKRGKNIGFDEFGKIIYPIGSIMWSLYLSDLIASHLGVHVILYWMVFIYSCMFLIYLSLILGENIGMYEIHD